MFQNFCRSAIFYLSQAWHSFIFIYTHTPHISMSFSPAKYFWDFVSVSSLNGGHTERCLIKGTTNILRVNTWQLVSKGSHILFPTNPSHFAPLPCLWIESKQLNFWKAKCIFLHHSNHMVSHVHKTHFPIRNALPDPALQMEVGLDGLQMSLPAWTAPHHNNQFRQKSWTTKITYKGTNSVLLTSFMPC